MQPIPYSPIVTRPKLRWPNGARIALWLVPNIEHYEYLPRPNQAKDPWPRMPHPDVLGYSRADYGNRVGYWRMVEVIDRYNIPCTVSLNLAVYEHFPEIMQECEARSWEILCHGIYNSDYLWDLPEDEERAIIEDCIATTKRLTGRDLLGWFSPAGTWTVNTPDLVAEAGLKYFVDWGGADDQPFPVRVRNGGTLLCLPYQFDVNDGINFRFNMEGEAFARATIELFDQLYRESGESGRAMCIPLHPFILGQPHRAKHLDVILRHIVAHDGVWMATAGQIADWYTQNCLLAVEAHVAEIAAMGASRATERLP
jgi:peptidoglycan/xylan/chitin deacetylase (PgdA/CDA1 family)